MRIVLTGGGTCGHIMPNLALVPYLKKHFENISYIGAKDSLEEKLCKENNIQFYYTDTIKLERKKIYKNIAIPFKLTKGISQAKDIFKVIKPDIVFSKGGYVALPAAFACKSNNIPLVIHESDCTLGVANKLSAKWADRIITTTAINTDDKRYVTIGNPIRDEIIKGNGLTIKKQLNLSPLKPTILVVGGSLGAEAINNVIYQCAESLVKNYNVIHIIGVNNTCNLKIPDYHTLNFAKNIGDYYASADLIISRAGANAVTEINALGKRVIYIPLPKGNSRGDQVDNAQKGGGLVLEQEQLNPSSLNAHILTAMQLPRPKNDYNINCPQLIIDEILTVLKTKNKTH